MDPDSGFGPISNASSSNSGSESVSMPDYTENIKNDGFRGENKKADEVFDKSAYFQKTEAVGEEVKYEAPGIQVRVEPGEVVEYSIECRQNTNDRAVQEFVEGIVRSMDDVNPSFRETVRSEVYGEKKVADGGSVENEEETSWEKYGMVP